MNDLMNNPQRNIPSLVPYTIHGQLLMSYPDLPANVFETLVRTVSQMPTKTALVEERESVTYADFLGRVNRLADALHHDYGIQPGDVCALLMVNSIDFCTAFYAILKLGAIALPLSTKFKLAELEHPLHHSKVNLLFLDETWLANIHSNLTESGVSELIFSGIGADRPEGRRLRNLAGDIAFDVPGPALEDGAILMYTSGTTGKSKGAFITHFNILHSIESYRLVLQISPDDSTIIATPIFHITGLVALLALFVSVGGTTHLLPFFNPQKTVQTIIRHQLTFFHASPTIFILLLEQRDHFPAVPSLQKGACGSANLPVDIIHQLHEWMPQFRIHPVYGLTETTSPATIMPEDPLIGGHAGSSGLAIPGLEMRIVSGADQTVLPAGATGELEVRGSVVIEKYFNADKEAMSSFRSGWFNTGDIALIDQDGYLFIMDRKKDMINRGGEKIYSIEVENMINRHPDVLECAVIGTPDPVFGEQVRAVVRLRPESQLDTETLSQYLKEHLAHFKVPVKYAFVDEIPKTENGKIDKKRLRKEECQWQ